jgi:hypothetical protein
MLHKSLADLMMAQYKRHTIIEELSCYHLAQLKASRVNETKNKSDRRHNDDHMEKLVKIKLSQSMLGIQMEKRPALIMI